MWSSTHATHLYAMVAGVGDDDVSLGVHTHALGSLQISLLVALLTEVVGLLEC